MRNAIEGKDPDALVVFYAENATLPDGKAFELRGRARIERYLGAICDQPMTCSVEGGAVYGEGSIAFVEACSYSGGRPRSGSGRCWRSREA